MKRLYHLNFREVTGLINIQDILADLRVNKSFRSLTVTTLGLWLLCSEMHA